MNRQFIQIGIGSVCELIDLAYHSWEGVFIECHPHNFAQACTAIYKEHPAVMDNISLVLGAVSEKDGFYQVGTNQILSKDAESSLPAISGENDRTRKSHYLYEIYAFSLETLFRRYPNADILMLDIQGAEYEVLKGLSDFVPPLLIVEAHGPTLHRNLIELMGNNGYEYLGYRFQTDDRDRPNLFFEYKQHPILTHLSDSERQIIGVQEIKDD